MAYFRSMVRNSDILLLLLPPLGSCTCAGEQAKRALNKGGELAGAAATEVVEGLATGAEKSWKVDISMTPELGSEGLIMGKTRVERCESGRENVVVVWLASEQGFADTLTAIAYDKEGLEMGRARLGVVIAPGMGDYHSIVFQEQTDLERKGRVLLR